MRFLESKKMNQSLLVFLKKTNRKRMCINNKYIDLGSSSFETERLRAPILGAS